MRVMLSMVAHSTSQPATAKAVAEANAALSAHGHAVSNFFISQESLISRARDAVAAQFLNGIDDVLVTVDSDIVFQPSDLICLLERKVAVVCANYPRKPDGRPTLEAPLGSFVQSREIALGLAAIRRDAFESLIRHRDNQSDFPLDFYPHRLNPCVWGFHVPFVCRDRYLSETEAFAHRLRQADVPLCVDGTLRLGHISKTILTLAGQEIP